MRNENHNYLFTRGFPLGNNHISRAHTIECNFAGVLLLLFRRKSEELLANFTHYVIDCLKFKYLSCEHHKLSKTSTIFENLKSSKFVQEISGKIKQPQNKMGAEWRFSSSCALEDGDVKSRTSITGNSKSDKEASRVAASVPLQIYLSGNAWQLKFWLHSSEEGAWLKWNNAFVAIFLKDSKATKNKISTRAVYMIS